METITSATKRKKRKTRKCLDEIRKRSRRCTNDSQKKSPMAGKLRETVSILNDQKKPISNNNYITSNRLTLAMFPKAIRSETITRPVLSEIKQDASNYNRIMTKARPSNAVPYDDNALPNEDSDFIKNSEEESISSAYDRCNELGHISLQKDSDSEHLDRGDRSEGSFIMFSPHAMHQSPETGLFEVSPNEQSVSTPTSSSQNIREGYRYQLYEEFMNEIPMCLRENAPTLLNEDVMKKTKAALHKIYIDSCRRESEDNILQCTSVSASSRPYTDRHTIIRNPMDYLRFGYAWRQNAAPVLSASRTLAADSMVESPAPSIINDTPEYTYYPHKLNQ